MKRRPVPLVVFQETCSRCVYAGVACRPSGIPHWDTRCTHPDVGPKETDQDPDADDAWVSEGRRECRVFYPRRESWLRRMLRGLGV